MVRRRDISAALIAAAARGTMLPQSSAASASGARTYPPTHAELAAGAAPLQAEFPPGNVLRYGADARGGQDASAAFQSACHSGAGCVVVPRGTYRLASTVSIDIATTSLEGEGATLISAVTTGSLLEIHSTGGAEACARHSISGLTLAGQGIPGVRAVRIEARNPHVAAGFAFRNCAFTAFDELVRIETNAFCINFIGCSFSQGGASGGIRVPAGGSNYGERIAFSECFFFNNAICLRSDYPATQFHLVNCSLDYSHQLIVMNAGWAQVSDCHVENDLDTAPWFVTGPGEASINLANCAISQTGPKPRHEIGLSASDTGALDFRNCLFYSSANEVRPTIVAGDGSAYGSGNRIIGFKRNSHAWGALSRRANLLTEIPEGLAGWVHGSSGSGGHPSVIADADLRAREALVFQVAAEGEDQYAYYPVSCGPGHNVGVVYRARASHADAPFECLLHACSASGTSIAMLEPEGGFSAWDGRTHRLTSAYRTYWSCFVNLPSGTAVCRAMFRTHGHTKMNQRVYVGDVLIGKY